MSLAQGFGENRAVKALLALIAVTAVWGVTFVQVKDAVAIYPLFAFLAVRFAIATGTLALPAARRVRGLGRGGVAGGGVFRVSAPPRGGVGGRGGPPAAGPPRGRLPP